MINSLTPATVYSVSRLEVFDAGQPDNILVDVLKHCVCGIEEFKLIVLEIICKNKSSSLSPLLVQNPGLSELPLVFFAMQFFMVDRSHFILSTLL